VLQRSVMPDTAFWERLRRGHIRMPNPRDEGVLSGALDVRSDLLRRLRASSPPQGGHRGVRAGVGAPPALHDGPHLRRAPRRGDLPVQGPALAKAGACPREGGGLPSRRRGPALAKAGDGTLTSDFFRRNVVLSFQEDAIVIRLRDVIGPDNMIWDTMMWGSDYPHSESTFPQSRKILAEILAGVPDDEQAKPAPDPDPGIAGGNTARVYNLDVARLTVPA
jgi:hypothetical protein